MDKIDKIIVNNAIIGLYREYNYRVDEKYYNSYSKKITVVNEHSNKRETSILLIDDTLFIDTIDKHLFSVYLIARLAKVLNIRISLYEI